jgi:hypothetical protein
MTVQELELAVGLHEAARLVIWKSKLGENIAQRFAPARKGPVEGLRTFVTRVTTWLPSGNFIQLNCGHAFVLEEDDANLSLVGAETICDLAHK